MNYSTYVVLVIIALLIGVAIGLSNNNSNNDPEDAMETIKGYCGKQKRCENCRFHKEERGCYFTQEIAPYDWEVDE